MEPACPRDACTLTPALPQVMLRIASTRLSEPWLRVARLALSPVVRSEAEQAVSPSAPSQHPNMPQR